MVEAIWYIMRTGCPWRDLPDVYGNWKTVYSRWRRWCAQGLWQQMLELLSQQAAGKLRHIDCSHIKVHQHGANPPGGQDAQAMGLTKGGLNSKIAAITDKRGKAVALNLCAGNSGEIQAVAPLLDKLHKIVAVADKGFDSDQLRKDLMELGNRCCIPGRSNRLIPIVYNKAFYRLRHHVENFFQRIKSYCRIATRYQKLALTFLSFVQFAAVLDWLK